MFALIFAFATLLADAIPTPAPQPAAPDPVPLQSVERKMTVDGIERTYFVYRPAKLPAGAHPPLVVAMHGGGSIAQGVETHYYWDQEADRGGFVAVYPQAVNRIWSARDTNPTDDVKFLSLIVSQMETEQGVDPRRIFFTGMSSGALMSYKMACDAKFPIAGIAPVSGTLTTTCATPQKVSVIAINGDADRMIPYYGGETSAPANAALDTPGWRTLPPVSSVLGKWMTLDGCAQPSTTRKPPVTTTIARCSRGRAVEGILISGAGHQWPGQAKHDGGGGRRVCGARSLPRPARYGARRDARHLEILLEQIERVTAFAPTRTDPSKGAAFGRGCPKANPDARGSATIPPHDAYGTDSGRPLRRRGARDTPAPVTRRTTSG
jgi:polyhydroxybutyrate depolymerase